MLVLSLIRGDRIRIYTNNSRYVINAERGAKNQEVELRWIVQPDKSTCNKSQVGQLPPRPIPNGIIPPKYLISFISG